MYRFLFLALLAVNVHAKTAIGNTQPVTAKSEGLHSTSKLESGEIESSELEYTELEHSIVSLSGLLSLSEQVKSSAQHMIAVTAAEAETAQLNNEATKNDKKAGSKKSSNKEAPLTINHAQHFGIAQSLSKSWSPAEWEKRLLVIVDSIDDETQVLIKKDLSKRVLKTARKKEKAAIAKQDKAEYQLYMNKLKQRSPAASRWALVEALDKQSGFSQLIIQVRSKVYTEMSAQVKDWQPPKNWQKAARQEVLEFLFYAYRKTPNGELKSIANNYDSPALKTLLSKVVTGL